MSITILGEKREGSGSIRKQGKRPVFEEQSSYIVQASDKTATRLAVLSTPGIPRVGLTLSAGGFAICQLVDCNRDPVNPAIWHVTANFASDVQEDTSGANESQSGDPTVWQPIAELSFETFTEVVAEDQSGTAIANIENLQLPVVRLVNHGIGNTPHLVAIIVAKRCRPYR